MAVIYVIIRNLARARLPQESLATGHSFLVYSDCHAYSNYSVILK